MGFGGSRSGSLGSRGSEFRHVGFGGLRRGDFRFLVWGFRVRGAGPSTGFEFGLQHLGFGVWNNATDRVIYNNFDFQSTWYYSL